MIVCDGAKARSFSNRLGTDAAQLVDEAFDYLCLGPEREGWRGYAKQIGFGIEDWSNWRTIAAHKLTSQRKGR